MVFLDYILKFKSNAPLQAYFSIIKLNRCDNSANNSMNIRACEKKFVA